MSEITEKVVAEIVSEEEYLQVKAERLPAKKRFSPADILDAYGEAFEIVGGVPRLAMWADEHPSKFYPVMARLATSQSGVNITSNGPLIIRPALPPTSLDEE